MVCFRLLLGRSKTISKDFTLFSCKLFALDHGSVIWIVHVGVKWRRRLCAMNVDNDDDDYDNVSSTWRIYFGSRC